MKSRPNILIFISDHLSPLAIGAYGDTYGATPTINEIASRGVLFSQIYTACPLCQPARAAFWTGRFPHETNVLSNGGMASGAFSEEPVPLDMPTLGESFSRGGYETVHFGKCHDMGSLRGFNIADQESIKIDNEQDCWPLNGDSYRDVDTTAKTVEYLKNPPQKPFLAVCDLQNPHNICGWVGENEGIHKDKALPEGVLLPPLPENWEIGDWENRPVPVQYACCSHNRLSQASSWNEENYRHYLAAYYYYTRRADRDIARVMEALNSTPASENTLVIVMADHGDGLARHRMVTKQVTLYDETTRVPFIMSGPGIPTGVEINNNLASLQDLFPTLCDYAGIETPPGLWGKSLLSALKGKKIHDYVVSEWHTEWGFTVSPGRMVRTENYKYNVYREGQGEELYDMINDRGETINLAFDPSFAAILEKHRDLLKKYAHTTGDNFFKLHVNVSPRFRSHRIGYSHHKGLPAPQFLRQPL
jgi:choline-sulfatase